LHTHCLPQGVKLSDTQATLSGMLTAGMFFFISSAKPLEQLSPQRPHPSIFNAYFFLSLCGQMALHMAFLVSWGGGPGRGTQRLQAAPARTYL
jgi:magnesium-transporting ATPase (P-type)